MDEKLQSFLDEPRFAVVATINEDGTPQQTVLWYQREGDEIMMNTARGRVKDRNLRRDPRLSFSLEDGYRYVTLRGSATLLDDQERAQEDIKRLAIRYHGQEHGERMSRETFRKQERVTIRMSVEHVDAHGL